MSHKTLIDSTVYEVTGGRTLVGGTAYDIESGRSLIGGTGYDISFITKPTMKDFDTGSAIDMYSMTYVNGYWVIVGTDNEGKIRLTYTRNIESTWSTVYLDTGYLHSLKAAQITYGNGYWVVSGSGATAEEEIGTAFIMYSTSMTGTWTRVDLPWKGFIGSSSGYSINYTPDVYCTTFANGYFVVGGGHYPAVSNWYARIAYATSPTGPWTTKDLWYETGAEIRTVKYANGYWIVGGVGYDGNGYTGRIAYATNPGGTWTCKDLWEYSDTHNEANIYDITYANGYWVACGWGRCVSSTSAAYWDAFGKIAYATSLGGTWTVKDLWSVIGLSTAGDYSDYHQAINCVTYSDGIWVIGGVYQYQAVNYFRIGYATNLAGPWTFKDLWTLNYKYGDQECIKHVGFDNGYLVVGAAYMDPAITVGYSYIRNARVFYGKGIESYEKL